MSDVSASRPVSGMLLLPNAFPGSFSEPQLPPPPLPSPPSTPPESDPTKADPHDLDEEEGYPGIPGEKQPGHP
jgi:hypothetical protein